jgi:hypothetical protein
MPDESPAPFVLREADSEASAESPVTSGVTFSGEFPRGMIPCSFCPGGCTDPDLIAACLEAVR